MSQGSQGSFAAGRVVLPLSKFSYATVHGESIIPIPWIHLGRTNNLFAIFESQRVENNNGQARDVKKFRVLQDPEVLEDIDLDILASEADRAKSAAQDPIMNGKIPSVTVIVKIPCVAIRYPLEGGQIRRMQIRLASNDDYYETLKILTRAGVPFGDAGSYPPPQPPARPFSSSSSLLRPGDSTSHLDPRPASVSSKMDKLPSIHVGASAEWASASSLRPTTSSGPVCGSSSGTLSSYFGQPSRSLGIVDNSRMSFGQAPGTSGLNEGFVSGYFAGQDQSHSIQPTPGSTSGCINTHHHIDLYQPRPLTAPFIGSQDLSLMLPPKRELPFFNPAPVKKIKKDSTRSRGAHANAESNDETNALSLNADLSVLRTSNSDAVLAMESKSEAAFQPAAIPPQTKGKRVATSRTTKPPAPKKQQVNASARGAWEAAKEQHPVPSGGELLKESDVHAKNVAEDSASIDTQALLSRVEATRPYQSFKLPHNTKGVGARSSSSGPSSQARKCDSCKSRKGKCDGKDPCDWCTDINVKCTYLASGEPEKVLESSSQPEDNAEQLSKAKSNALEQASTPPQKVVQHSEANATGDTEPELDTPKVCVTQAYPQEPEPPRTSRPPTVDPDATHINEAPPLLKAGITSASASLHVANDSLLTLIHREAAFTQCNQLKSWADLPETVQRNTLGTWMCQQLNDPGFAALVKRLDESWQASLLGRSVGFDL